MSEQLPHESQMIDHVPGFEPDIQPMSARSDDMITHVPSQKELVDAGYGIQPIADRQEIRDDWAVEALAQTSEVLKNRISDPSVAHEVDSILERGVDAVTGQKFWGSEWARDHQWGNVATRQLMANMRVHDPEAYRAMRDGRVAGFHGTRSVALAGVLKTGKLSSAMELDTMGKEEVLAVGGERAPGDMPRISFSSLDDVMTPRSYAGYPRDESLAAEEVVRRSRERILNYETLQSQGVSEEMRAGTIDRERQIIDEIENRPDSLESVLLKDDFPVMFGIDGAFVAQLEDDWDPRFSEVGTRSYGQSDQAEFRPLASSLPLDRLPVIAVPKAHVPRVRELLRQFGRHNDIIALESVVPPGFSDEDR